MHWLYSKEALKNISTCTRSCFMRDARNSSARVSRMYSSPVRRVSCLEYGLVFRACAMMLHCNLLA